MSRADAAAGTARLAALGDGHRGPFGIKNFNVPNGPGAPDRYR